MKREDRSLDVSSGSQQPVPMWNCFKVVMAEMVNLEEMDVMECLVLKDYTGYARSMYQCVHNASGQSR